MPAPRKYPDELRERAIREVQTSGRSVAHVARDLGIHKEALRGWVRQAEADQGGRPDLLTTAERTELAQLRKEVAELQRANDLAASAARAQSGAVPTPHGPAVLYPDVAACGSLATALRAEAEGCLSTVPITSPGSAPLLHATVASTLPHREPLQISAWSHERRWSIRGTEPVRGRRC